MNEFTKMFEQMMEQGQKMVRSLNPALEHFQPGIFEKMWPTLPRDLMEAFWGNTFNPEGLDAKTRLMILLAGLVAQGAVNEPLLKTTVRHLLSSGATQKEIAEVIYQMSMLGGLPAMTKALEIAQAIFAETEEGGA